MGGASGDGTVFELAHGSGTITALASFNGTNGSEPEGSLIMDSSGNLYGTANTGGTYSDGTVFELTHGSGTITALASFNDANGEAPIDGLIMDTSGNLYGSTRSGGAFVRGTVFELAKGSGTITTLASFNGSDGAFPYGGVIMDSSGNLYGTTSAGAGSSSYGTVFELAHGSGTITTLASFNSTNGCYPAAGLIMDSSGNLYWHNDGWRRPVIGTVFEFTRADALPALRISGQRSSTGAASRTFTATVPNALSITDNDYAGTVDVTTNGGTADLTANDTAPEMGTSPFSGFAPRRKGRPSSTDTLLSSIASSLSADGS